MNTPRITQRDIALEAKVDRSTVSMALRNHPDIPTSTRKRIQAIAQKLGYIPDPMLSAIASYRNRKRTRPYQGTLAWLTNDSPPFVWSKVTMYQGYFRGGQRRALAYGYNLEIFPLNEHGRTPERLSRILRSRNIQGLLVCPQPTPNGEIDFPWENFSAITFGYTLRRPKLYTVVASHFPAVTEAIRRMREFGYTRIGLTYSPEVDERTNHNFLGAYLTDCFLNNPGQIIPPYDERNPDPKAFRNWFDTYTPEAILTGNPLLLDVIRKAGVKVPSELGVASFISSTPKGALSGIYEDSERSGETAVDLLVEMIQHGRRGIPERPLFVHIPGIWIPGRTLRRLKP